MVNDKNFESKGFSSESTPLIIDLKGQLLINWYNAVQDVSKREYYSWKGADAHKEETKRTIFTLFTCFRSSLKNDFKAKEFETMKYNITNKDAPIKDTIESFYIINDWLYKKGLTKFDTKQIYQRNRAELANQHKDY